MTTPVQDAQARVLSSQDVQAIRDAARQAASEARAAAQQARDAVLGGQGAGSTIDLLRAEIAGVRQEIQGLTSQLGTADVSSARERVLEGQIEGAQERLVSLQERLDRLISGDDSSPGAVANPFQPDAIPQQAVEMTYAVLFTIGVIAVGVPLARGISRWMERRGQPAGQPDVTPRLDRIEQAVEAVAIEVERISEGQRYTNRLVGEMRALPAAGAPPVWSLAPREPVPVERTEKG